MESDPPLKLRSEKASSTEQKKLNMELSLHKQNILHLETKLDLELHETQ
jgi:hypothetical protein